jgi:hypothetical protein
MTITTYDTFPIKKQELLTQFIDLKRRATKNKALLSLKYESLLFKINLIQVSVIIFSTVITLLESLKGILGLEGIEWELVPIIISFYITVIMSILRFFKWEAQKESISKCHENHTFVINKLEKVYNVVSSFQWNDGCEEKWENIVSSFEDDLFDNFVSAKVTFDTILSYRDIIYYKERFKKLYLEMEFSNQDIDLIRRSSSLPHHKYMNRYNCFLRWCCCYPKEYLNVKKFLMTAYDKFGVPKDHDSINSGHSRSTYVHYRNDETIINNHSPSTPISTPHTESRSLPGSEAQEKLLDREQLDPIREEPEIIEDTSQQIIAELQQSLEKIDNNVKELTKAKIKSSEVIASENYDSSNKTSQV